MASYLQILKSIMDSMDMTKLSTYLHQKQFSDAFESDEVVKTILDNLDSINNGTFSNPQEFKNILRELINAKLQEKLEDESYSFIEEVSKYNNYSYEEQITSINSSENNKVETSIQYFVFGPRQFDVLRTSEKRSPEDKIVTYECMSNSYLQHNYPEYSEFVQTENEYIDINGISKNINYTYFCIIKNKNRTPNEPFFEDNVKEKILNSFGFEYIDVKNESQFVLSLLKTHEYTMLVKINLFPFFKFIASSYNEYFDEIVDNVSISDFVGRCYFQKNNVVLVPEHFKYFSDFKYNPNKYLNVTIGSEIFKNLIKNERIKMYLETSNGSFRRRFRYLLPAVERKTDSFISISLRDLGINDPKSASQSKTLIVLNKIMCSVLTYILNFDNNTVEDFVIESITDEYSVKFNVRNKHGFNTDDLLKTTFRHAIDDEFFGVFSVNCGQVKTNLKFERILNHTEYDEKYKISNINSVMEILNRKGFTAILNDIKSKRIAVNFSFLKVKEKEVFSEDPQDVQISNFSTLSNMKMFNETLLRQYFLSVFENRSEEESVTFSDEPDILYPINMVPVSSGRIEQRNIHHYVSKFPFVKSNLNGQDINSLMLENINKSSNTQLKFMFSDYEFDPIKAYKTIALTKDSTVSYINSYLVFNRTEPVLSSDSPVPLKVDNISQDKYIYIMRNFDGEPRFVDPLINPIDIRELKHTDLNEEISSNIYFLKKISLDNIYVSEGNLERFKIEVMNSSIEIKLSSFLLSNLYKENFKGTNVLLKDFIEVLRIYVENIFEYSTDYMSKIYSSLLCYINIIKRNSSNFSLRYLHSLDVPKESEWCSTFFQLFVKSISTPISNNNISYMNNEIGKIIRYRCKLIVDNIISDLMQKIPEITDEKEQRDEILSNKNLSEFEISILNDVFSKYSILSDLEEAISSSYPISKLKEKYESISNRKDAITSSFIEDISNTDYRILSCVVSVIREILSKSCSISVIDNMFKSIGIDKSQYKVIEADNIIIVLENPIESYLTSETNSILTDGLVASDNFKYVLTPKFENTNILKRYVNGNSLIHVYFKVTIDNNVNKQEHDSRIIDICNMCLFYQSNKIITKLDIKNIVIESITSEDNKTNYLIYVDINSKGSILSLKQKHMIKNGCEFECVSNCVNVSVLRLFDYQKETNIKVFESDALCLKKILTNDSISCDKLTSDNFWFSTMCDDILLDYYNTYFSLILDIDCLNQTSLSSEIVVTFTNIYSTSLIIRNKYNEISDITHSLCEDLKSIDDYNFSELIESIENCEKTDECFRNVFRYTNLKSEEEDVLCILDTNENKLTTETYGIVNEYDRKTGNKGLTVTDFDKFSGMKYEFDNNNFTHIEQISVNELKHEINKKVEEQINILSRVNIELSLSLGYVSETNIESFEFYKKDSILWNKFSKDGSYLAIGLPSSVIIYNKISEKYFRIAVLYHDDVTDIVFSKIHCVTISNTTNTNSVKLWLIPSSTQLNYYIHGQVYSVGDIVDCDIIKGDKYEHLTRVAINSIYYKGYISPIYRKEITVTEVKNKEQTTKLVTVFYKNYDDYVNLNRDSNDSTDSTILTEEQFYSEYKKFTFKDKYGLVSGYDDPIFIINGKHVISEEEFYLNYTPIYKTNNDVISNLKSSINFFEFYFSPCDKYLIYNRCGILTVLNLSNLKPCSILGNNTMSVVNGNWSKDSSNFIGVSRNNADNVILKKIDSNTFEYTILKDNKQLLNICPVSYHETESVNDKSKFFFLYRQNLELVLNKISNFFWLYDIFIGYFLQEVENEDFEMITIYFATEEDCVYLKFPLLSSEEYTSNFINRKRKNEIECYNFTNIMDFMSSNFVIERNQKTELFFLDYNIFDIGLKAVLNFYLPIIKFGNLKIYFQGNMNRICSHSYSYGNTQCSIHEEHSLISNNVSSDITPIYFEGNFYFVNAYFENAIMKTISDFSKGITEYNFKDVKKSQRKVKFNMFNVSKQKVVYNKEVTGVIGVDNFPISKLLYPNRYKSFTIKSTEQSSSDFVLGNLLLSRDQENKNIMKIVPRYVQVNNEKNFDVDTDLLKLYKNMSKENFECAYNNINALIERMMNVFPSLFYSNKPDIFKYFYTPFSGNTYDQFIFYVNSFVKQKNKKSLSFNMTLDENNEIYTMLKDSEMFDIFYERFFKMENVFEIFVDVMKELDFKNEESLKIMNEKLDKEIKTLEKLISTRDNLTSNPEISPDSLEVSSINNDFMSDDIDDFQTVSTSRRRTRKPVATASKSKPLDTIESFNIKIDNSQQIINALRAKINSNNTDLKNRKIEIRSKINNLIPDVLLPEDDLLKLFDYLFVRYKEYIDHIKSKEDPMVDEQNRMQFEYNTLCEKFEKLILLQKTQSNSEESMKTAIRNIDSEFEKKYTEIYAFEISKRSFRVEDKVMVSLQELSKLINTTISNLKEKIESKRDEHSTTFKNVYKVSEFLKYITTVNVNDNYSESLNLIKEYVNISNNVKTMNLDVVVSPISFRSNFIRPISKIISTLEFVKNGKSYYEMYSNIPYRDIILKAKNLAIQYYSMSNEFFLIDSRVAKEFSLNAPLENIVEMSEKDALDESINFLDYLKSNFVFKIKDILSNMRTDIQNRLNSFEINSILEIIYNSTEFRSVRKSIKRNNSFNSLREVIKDAIISQIKLYICNVSINLSNINDLVESIENKIVDNIRSTLANNENVNDFDEEENTIKQLIQERLTMCYDVISGRSEEYNGISEFLKFKNTKKFKNLFKNFTVNDLSEEIYSKSMIPEKRNCYEILLNYCEEIFENISTLRYNELVESSRKVPLETEISKSKIEINKRFLNITKLISYVVDFQKLKDSSELNSKTKEIKSRNESIVKNIQKLRLENNVDSESSEIVLDDISNEERIVHETKNFIKAFRLKIEKKYVTVSGEEKNIVNDDVSNFRDMKYYGNVSDPNKKLVNFICDKLSEFIKTFFIPNSDFTLTDEESKSIIPFSSIMFEDKELYISSYNELINDEKIANMKQIITNLNNKIGSLSSNLKSKTKDTESNNYNEQNALETDRDVLNNLLILKSLIEVISPFSQSSIFKTCEEIIQLDCQIKKNEKLLDIFKTMRMSGNTFYEFVDQIIDEPESINNKIAKLEFICSEIYEQKTDSVNISNISTRSMELLRNKSKSHNSTEEYDISIERKKNSSKKIGKNTKGHKRTVNISDDVETTEEKAAEISSIELTDYWTYVFPGRPSVKYRIHRDRYRVVKSKEMFYELMQYFQNRDFNSVRVINKLLQHILIVLSEISKKKISGSSPTDVFNNLIKSDLYTGLYFVIEHALQSRLIFDNKEKYSENQYDIFTENIYSFLSEIIENTFCDPLSNVGNLKTKTETTVTFNSNYLVDKFIVSKFIEKSDETIVDWMRLKALFENPTLYKPSDLNMIEYVLNTYPETFSNSLIINKRYSYSYSENVEYVKELNTKYSKFYDSIDTRIKNNKLFWYCIAGNSDLPSDSFKVFYPDYHVKSIYERLSQLTMYLINGQYLLDNYETLPESVENKLYNICKNASISINETVEVNVLYIEFEHEFEFDSEIVTFCKSEKDEVKIKFLTKSKTNSTSLNIYDIICNALSVSNEKSFRKYDFDKVSFRTNILKSYLLRDILKQDEKNEKEIERKQMNIDFIKSTFVDNPMFCNKLVEEKLKLENGNILRDTSTGSVVNINREGDFIRTILYSHDKLMKIFKSSDFYKLLSKEVDNITILEYIYNVIQSTKVHHILENSIYYYGEVSNVITKTTIKKGVELSDGDVINVYTDIYRKNDLQPEITLRYPMYFSYGGVNLNKIPVQFPTYVKINNIKYALSVSNYVETIEVKKGVNLKMVDIERTLIALQHKGSVSFYKSKTGCIVDKESIVEQSLSGLDKEGKIVSYNLDNLNSLFEQINVKNVVADRYTPKEYYIVEHNNVFYQVEFYSIYEKHSIVPRDSYVSLYNLTTEQYVFKWHFRNFQIYDVSINFNSKIPKVNILGIWKLKNVKVIRYGSINLTEEMKSSFYINSFDTEIDVDQFVTNVNSLKLSRTSIDIIEFSGDYNEKIKGKYYSKLLNFVMICSTKPCKIHFNNSIQSVTTSKLGKYFSVTYGRETIQSNIYTINGLEIKRVSGYAKWI